MLESKAVNAQPSVIKVGGISEMTKILKDRKKKKYLSCLILLISVGFLASLHLASTE